MNINNIVSSISSLVPFWAAKIIEYCGLGNEYSMIVNIVLQQLLTPLEFYITEDCIYILIFSLVIIILCWKNNLIDTKIFNMRVKKSYTIIGSEKDNIIDYCDTMNALTSWLIDEYKYNNIIVSKSTKYVIMLGEVTNHKLKTDLYLTISRNNSEHVRYSLSSYNIDLNQLVHNMKKKYDLTENKRYIHMYGTETQSTYNYSQSLTSVTYTLVHKYQLTNLINKNSSCDIDDKINIKNNNNNDKDQNKSKISRYDQIANEKRIKSIYLIDEYKDHKLEEDVYITIIRMGDLVKYSFYSEKRNLIEFIDKCDNYYNTNINNTKYKHRLIFQGTEISGERSKTKNIYPKQIIAINYHLIYKCNYKNYRIIENNISVTDKYGESYSVEEERNPNMFKYMIEDVGSIIFDNIILTIKRYSSAGYGLNTTVDYIFESDTVDLEKYINNCSKTYDTIVIEKNKNKLYHFTLLSIDDGEPNFSTELIFDEIPLLNESFDNIYTEHNDLLIKDLAKLKDLEYYKRTGLKRKKSYLQYGEPGCGKTATTIAAALHDKRHIIDIPMSLIQTCSDLEIIMSLNQIDDISFTKDKIIIHFDEIDIGLKESLFKRSSKLSQSKPDVNDNEDNNNNDNGKNKKILSVKNNADIIQKITDIEEMVSIKLISLNLGALLSKFDGICNYNGLVIIATTNNKEKLDPALYREMRLTPLYYTYSRKEDIKGIISKFFPVSVKDIIIDFDISITPAKLTFLCEKFEHYAITDFVKMLRDLPK